MTNYTLYKSSDLVTPFVIISENTVDTSHTSVSLVGQRKEAYGQPEQQSKLWMLENFAKPTKPVAPMKGQHWFNTTDNKMYVCVDNVTQAFQKVSNPISSPTTPITGYIHSGDLWYNTSDGFLYVYDAVLALWIKVGSGFNSISNAVYEVDYLSAVTTDGNATEMFVNGLSPNRLVLPINTSWNFDIKIIGRSIVHTNEVASFNLQGVINRDVSAPALLGGIEKKIMGISAILTTADAGVSADVSNNSLKVLVTGLFGEQIRWNAIATLTKVSN